MEVIKGVKAVGSVLVLNCHPNLIANDAMLAVIRTFLQDVQDVQDVQGRRAWGATLKNVAAYWGKREWIEQVQAE